MKKKWYQSAACKGIMLVVAHVSLITMVICSIWLAVAAGYEYLNPFAEVPKTYAGTTVFESDLNAAAYHILGGAMSSEKFKTDGKLDRDKLVDIEQYLDDGTITGENESGVAYKLGDLMDWSDRMTWGDDEEQTVIVCRKPDGTYQYYHWSDFRTRINEGELRFINTSTEETSSMLEEVRDYYGDYSDNYFGISDAEGKILYDSCWNLGYNGERLDEAFAPDGAVDLVEIANKNPDWNGRLTELYDRVENVINRIGNEIGIAESVEESWKEGDTNLSYMLIDNDHKRVYTNREAYRNYKDAEENYEKLKHTADGGDASYVSIAPSLQQFEAHMDSELRPSEWQSMVQMLVQEYDLKDFQFIISVDTTYPIQDMLYENHVNYEKIQPYIENMSVLVWVGLGSFILSALWLTVVAGRSNRTEGVALSMVDKWPTELTLISIGTGIGILIGWIAERGSVWGRYSYYQYEKSNEYVYQIMSGRFMGEISGEDLIMTGVVAAIACFLGFLGYLSIVRRLKAHTFWKSSFLRMILKWIRSIWRFLCRICRTFWKNRGIVTKRAIVCAGFLFLHYLAFAGGGFVFLMLIADAAAVISLLGDAIAKQKVKTGIQRIADGEVEYQIPTEHLRGDNKEIAECVNHIGEGLNAAVEQSLKSERMKTDLITNVSHDIKTPLTSIINYVALLKRENFEDPKIQGYLDILDAKSQRLKTLTEDVVEASKISSGNIHLEMIDLNLVEIVQQTSGEFLEKFEARNLKLISNLPERPVLIRADGRRMWRILANVYNNAAKYAMEGTRIYADMVMTDNTVSFSLKNISEQPLNISADELTERFIRGDISRSTEGSGLGLSIAKNLTERQNGEFKVYLDGDLFKITIIFPRVRK